MPSPGATATVEYPVSASLMTRCREDQVAPSQTAFVAVPEKALLDLFYLEPNSATPAYIHELRLQNLESLNLERLNGFAEKAASPKLRAAATLITELAQASEYEAL